MEDESRLRQERFWNQAPVRDLHWKRSPNVFEAREHSSTAAFVKGPRWYAKSLFAGKAFLNNRVASHELIASSRRLLAESRQMITKTRNTLIFSRSGKRPLN